MNQDQVKVWSGKVKSVLDLLGLADLNEFGQAAQYIDLTQQLHCCISHCLVFCVSACEGSSCSCRCR